MRERVFSYKIVLCGKIHLDPFNICYISYMSKKPIALDLFAGCGGFSEGFRHYFDIVVANDIWEPALKTYRHNHKDTKIILGDICDRNIKKDILQNFKDKKCDVIIGGPPCQGFSMAGFRKKDDPRNKLILEYIDIVKTLKPKVLIIENVKGLISMKNENGEHIVDIVKKEFKKIGYNVEFRVLNVADYGVPQKRERVIFIGSKDIENIRFPKKMYSENSYKTVEWAISDLENVKEDVTINHIFTKHSNEFVKKIRNTPINKSVMKSYSDAFFRLNPKLPSRTVKENHGGVFVHYKNDRVMTPRELARLQSFRDGFIFKGTKSQILVQIGNAVPPLFAKKLAKELIKVF